MQAFDISAWAPGSQLLLLLAQALANRLSHSITSGVHVARVLLDMDPIRRGLGADLANAESAVARGLLLMPRSDGKVALLTQQVHRALTTGDRSTADFVTRALDTGLSTLRDAADALERRASGIARLLDAPRLHEVLRAPLSERTALACGPFTAGYLLASTSGHAMLTTRHVIAATMQHLHEAQARVGRASWGDDLAHVFALLEAVQLRRGEPLIHFSPRLVGALAGATAVSSEDESLLSPFLVGCFAGDETMAPFRPRVFVQAQKSAAA